MWVIKSIEHSLLPRGLSEGGERGPLCFAIGTNLCVKHHYVHRTLIGGFYLFARRGYVCLFLILGNEGDYASNLL